jgi:multidrug efflux pump subunit AcrB
MSLKSPSDKKRAASTPESADPAAEQRSPSATEGDPDLGDLTVIVPRGGRTPPPRSEGEPDLSDATAAWPLPDADATVLSSAAAVLSAPAAGSATPAPDSDATVYAHPPAPPVQPPRPPLPTAEEEPERGGFNLGVLLVAHYRVAIMAVLGLLIYGLMAFFTIPRTEDPEFDNLAAGIVTIYPGAAASKVESLVTKKIEEKIEEIEEVRTISSQSLGGISIVGIRFWGNEAPQDTIDDIKEKLKDLRRELPQEIVDPEVKKVNAADIPVVILSLQGPYDYNQLNDWAEKLDQELSELPGVSSVDVEGMPERNILVNVDNQRLSQYVIPLIQIPDILKGENAAIPGGKFDVGPRRYMIKNPNEYENLDQIANTVIGSYGKSVVHLRDVATVEDGFEDTRYKVRTNGEPALLLAIKKQDYVDTTRVAEEVRSKIDELRRTLLPDALQLHFISDRGKTVSDQLGSLGSNAVSGAFMTMAMVAFYLGIRQALVVSISIPLSILVCFILMQAFGITLNSVSIFGLALALGSIVDASMVVIESISDHLHRGEPLTKAVTEGLNEVNLPVFSSTLTNASAFIPLLFIGGDAGRFLFAMPMTNIFALLASNLVAVTVIPLLCYPLFKNRPPQVHEEKSSRFLDGYTALAKFALRNRLVTVGIAIAAFVSSLLLIPHLGIEFFPKAEKSFFLINIRLPKGTNLDTTNEITTQVEKILAAEAPIHDYTANIGRGSPQIFYNEPRENEQPNYAQFVVNLKDDFTGSTDDYVAALRGKLHSVFGATVEPKILAEGPVIGAAIEVRIIGDDLEILAGLARDDRQQISEIPGVADLRDNMGEKIPELRMNLNKEKAGLLNVSTMMFSRTVLSALNGEVATQFRHEGDEIPIVVRLDRRSLQETSNLYSLYLPSTGGRTVPLAEVASVETTDEFGQVNRRNARRSVAVQLDVSGRLVGDVMADIQQKLRDFRLPAHYEMEFGGEHEERDESFGNVQRALVLALLMIYAILALQFNSFVQPFVIVLTIPFGIVGAVFGLWLTGNPFGFMAFIGIVSLTGIVINDSILLCDCANQAQRVEGKGMFESILLAGRRRFQPVMLTSISTIVGLAPLAIWGGSLWAPLATALVFGDLVSTVLILLIMPVFYSLLVSPRERTRQYRIYPTIFHRLRRWFRTEPVRPTA